MNRGIARRSVFEDRHCTRYFLSRLARAVRAGDLEVHAYVLMTTHFHLLVCSPTGRLSESLRLIQNVFVRWFNRRNRRDGPLFRGRFLSRQVETMTYRQNLLSYIDQNPVQARIVEAPWAYPYGSAHHYVHEAGPRWLQRSWVEHEVMKRTDSRRYSGHLYGRAFGRALTASERDVIERRLEHPSREPDPLDDLIGATPEAIASWMQRKARLADGTRPGLPCSSADRVLTECARAHSIHATWRIPRGGNRVNPWEVIQVAALRDIAGLAWSQIHQRTSVSPSAARRRYEIHQHWMATRSAYVRAVQDVAQSCLQGECRRVLS